MVLTARGVTGGSDINVLVDPGATGDMQLTKLAAGTVASEELVGTTDLGATHALWTDDRIQLGTQSQASSGLTTASTNYSIGDTLGAGWTFTSMARASGLGGFIKGISLLDKGDVMSACDLYISPSSITFGSDNSAPGVSDSDAQGLRRITGLGFYDLGGCRLATLDSLNVAYMCAATSLYVYAVTTVANNFFAAATDLYLTLDFVTA